jgi:drug/metabolite transporter (DMT)-like permease
MSWLFFAFSGPVLWAISTHLDKYLVERYFKDTSVAVLLVFTALMGLVLLPFIWAYEPGVTNVPVWSALIIIASGLLYMGAIFFYLQALQSEEASTVAPFFQASPLFAYALGYVVLGERLSAMQLLGGGLIVAGAVLLSVRPGGAMTFKTRLVVLMLACALCVALSSLIFKIFAVSNEFWTTTFWTFVGQAIIGAAILAVPAHRRQFVDLFRVHRAALITINASNELINLGGGLGARYALILAPLSIVQAITSTSTLFVFLFGMILSIFFPALGREDLSPKELTKKGFSAVLIVAGVILVSR